MVNLSQEGINLYLAKLLNQVPATISAGSGQVFDARGMSKITMIPSDATTDYAYSQVDTEGASAHDATSKISVLTGAITTINVEWSFYYIDATTEDLRVDMV